MGHATGSGCACIRNWKEFIGDENKEQLLEEIELLDGASAQNLIRSWSAKESFRRYFSVPH